MVKVALMIGWLMLPAASGRATAQHALTPGSQKSVLAVYSVRADSPAAVGVDPVLQRILGDSLGGGLDYYAEFMDSGRFSDPDYPEAFAQFLRSKYQRHPLDLIIATGDRALAFVVDHRGDPAFTGVPVVFNVAAAGVTRPSNATGIIAPLTFRESLDSAIRLQPETARVVVVSGASPTDHVYERTAREQFAPLAARLDFTYLSGLPIGDVLERVAVMPAHSILFLTSLLEDGDGRHYTTFESAERLSTAANAPLYTWFAPVLGHGIVGGRMLSLEVLSQRTAELGVRVLRGEQPASVPVTTINWGVTQFDARQLRRWKISEARLPAGSTLRFDQPDLWERYGRYLIAGSVLVILQTGLIATLLFQRRRRMGVERALRENERRHTLATVAGAVGVWDWNFETNAVYVDPEVAKLLGFDEGELPGQLDALRSRVHPEDAPSAMAQWRACMAGEADACDLELRMLHRDGSVRWFLVRGSVMADAGGAPRRLVGTAMDITARKLADGRIRESEADLRESHRDIQRLAGRLIEAQESERARIARDLHDDVSQQLAAMSIALSALNRRIGPRPGGEDLHDEVSSLQRRTIALADNVRHLSHDLHPAVLRHAGLVAALGAYCAELRRHYPLELTCDTDGDFDALDPETALCVYRVAQEALRNVVMHAGARHAAVRLRRIDGSVELTIADDGRGFDSVGTRRSAKGLGLVSINERVRLTGGTVSIVTELDKGTRVRVQVPVTQPAAVAFAAAAFS
jgi:PAS domain S-box-containing protein